jgi:8-oxo-dGTP pyrophosphatase MutT (NUDIX family)
VGFLVHPVHLPQNSFLSYARDGSVTALKVRTQVPNKRLPKLLSDFRDLFRKQSTINNQQSTMNHEQQTNWIYASTFAGFDANASKLPAVSLAILFRERRFLMQLRDDIPNIAYPGHWGLFGGHLEPGETPAIGFRRELEEEINYIPEQQNEFRCYVDEKIIRYIYYAPLTVPLSDLELQEGWDLGLLTPEDIKQGSFYSAKALANKPLGGVHQQILLDFLATKSHN